MIIISQYSTDGRKRLLMFFKENIHGSFSARQIHKLLGNNEISISSIYRNLVSMERDGILCRVKSPTSREALYQYIDPENCVGIIHLICDRCSATQHLNRHLSDLITNMALDNFGFSVNKQKAVIYGLCSNCSQI